MSEAAVAEAGAERPVASIRTCMLSYYFYPRYSGSAVQVHNLCRNLQALGVHCLALSANLTASPSRERVQHLDVVRVRVLKHPFFAIPSFWLSMTWFLISNRRDIDIIHAHGTYYHSFASLIGLWLGKKTILKIAMSNSDIAFQRQGRIWGRINRFLVERFDRYIATSHEAYQECIQQGLDPQRVLLVPNGVDTGRFKPASSPEEKRALRRELGLPHGPLVCFVGVIDARKNVDGLLRAWAKVRARCKIGHLVLVGPIQKDASGHPAQFHRELMEFLDRERLSETVTFADAQPAVDRYLASADLFFFTSRREGMPNVVLEAMASGLPCVASNIGGIVDLVQHGETGFVFAVDDVDSQASAVAELIERPQDAQRMGLAARAVVTTRFSLEQTAQRYEELYANLIRAAP